MLLLHGFPECWIFVASSASAALAKAGFRAMAPDLRGYNLSDKPSDVMSMASIDWTATWWRWSKALGYQRLDVVGMTGAERWRS